MTARVDVELCIGVGCALRFARRRRSASMEAGQCPERKRLIRDGR